MSFCEVSSLHVNIYRIIFFLPQIWYKWLHEEISAFPLHVCLYLIFAGAPWAVYSHITVVHWVAGHHRAVWLVPSVVRDPHPIPTGMIEYQCEMYENEQKNLQQSSIFQSLKLILNLNFSTKYTCSIEKPEVYFTGYKLKN